MDRKTFQDCMRPHMKGKKTPIQRQRDMCIGAKLCSGKAKTQKEAEAMCSKVGTLLKKPKKSKKAKAK